LWFNENYSTYTWKQSTYNLIKHMAGKRLFTFLEDNQGLSKICDFTTNGSTDYFFKNIHYYISREEITLDPLPSTDVIRPEKLEWMDNLVQYCKDKISDNFNYFYESNTKDFNPVVRARRDNVISLTNNALALNEAEARYLFDNSDVAWWGYQWANVGFRTHEFFKSTFINENGFTFRVYMIDSESDDTYSVQFIDPDYAGTALNYEITRNELAKALLGLSFKAYNKSLLNPILETFQALSLPNKKRLPILIGDIVELISTKGKSAKVGSKGLVSEVSLYSTVWVEEMPYNINTMVDVTWLDEEMANGQGDGGYAIQDFKNFSRPEFESLKITNKVAENSENNEESIDPLRTDIKIKVANEDEAKALQEWAFKKGVSWGVNGATLSFLDEIFLIVEKGVLLYYGKHDPKSQDLFNEDPAKLVTLEELGIVVPTPSSVSKSIDPLKDAIKIKVQNEDEAKAFEEWAFSKGVKWAGIGGTNIQNLDAKYFYISKGSLTYGRRGDVFNSEHNKQVTLEELGISVPSEPIREALQNSPSQPEWVQSEEEDEPKLTKENLWGKSVEETNPKLKIDFAEALKIIDKPRRTESDKVKLTLFFCNVYYVEKGTKEYDVLAKEYDYASRLLPNKIYFVEPKPEFVKYGIELEIIIQGSELQLENWIVSLPWMGIQMNSSTDKDKTAMKQAIISVAVDELGQESVDSILKTSISASP